MENTAIFTISSKNYFAFAKTMLQSVREQHDDVDLFFLLSDEIVDGDILDCDGLFELLLAKDLGIPDFQQMSFAYDIVEFNTAVKPFFIKYLFDKGYRKVIYIDPDILVCNRLDIALDALKEKSIVVTPHLLTPGEDVDKFVPYLLWEQASLQTGIFNLGFLGVSNTVDGREFVRWWSNRCNYLCFDYRDGGVFVDQKWVNLIVCFFDSFFILKHMGYNMSVWNLHERVLIDDNVNGEDPLVFYHFSSIDIDDLTNVAKYGRPPIKLESRPDLRDLFFRYQDAVKNNGYDDSRNFTYAYGYYADGRKISLLDRRIYLACVDNFPDPFQSSGWQFYRMWKKKRYIRSNPNSQNKSIYINIVKSIRELISKILGPFYYHRLKKMYEKRKHINPGSFIC